MAKKSKTSFKKDKKETKDTNPHKEEYSKEFNQVIHNNPPLKVTKQRGTWELNSKSLLFFLQNLEWNFHYCSAIYVGKMDDAHLENGMF